MSQNRSTYDLVDIIDRRVMNVDVDVDVRVRVRVRVRVSLCN